MALVQIDCKMAQLEVTRASTRSVLGDSWSVTELAGVLVESLERVLLLLLLLLLFEDKGVAKGELAVPISVFI